MKKITFWLLALPIWGFMMFTPRQAQALWVKMEVTANGEVNGQQFTIITKDVEQFKQLEITIAPKPKDVSPFLTGELSLIAGDKWVASVPVSEKWEKGVVTYTFKVTPDTIAQSLFEIHSSMYAPASKGRNIFGTAMIGKRKVQEIMGGVIYALKLKDFVNAKAK